MEAPKTPAQWYATVGGAFVLALGVLSLIILGVEFNMIDQELTGENDFLLWQASGWTTIMWIAAGALGLFAMSRVDAARTYALVAGIFFTVLAVWGFIDGNDVASLFAAGTTNNITHAALGVLGLIAGMPPERTQREYGAGEGVREERAITQEPTARRTRSGGRL